MTTETQTQVLAGFGPSVRIKVPSGSKVTVIGSSHSSTLTLDKNTTIKFAA